MRPSGSPFWSGITESLVSLLPLPFIWGFPKMVDFPNNYGFSLTKMIILGCEMGVPPFKETPISSKVYTKSVRRFFQPQEPDFCHICPFFLRRATMSLLIVPQAKCRCRYGTRKRDKSWEVVVVHIDRKYPYHYYSKLQYNSSSKHSYISHTRTHIPESNIL